MFIAFDAKSDRKEEWFVISIPEKLQEILTLEGLLKIVSHPSFDCLFFLKSKSISPLCDFVSRLLTI